MASPSNKAPLPANNDEAATEDVEEVLAHGDPEAVLDVLAIRSLRMRYSDDDVIPSSVPIFPCENDLETFVRDFAIDDAISGCFADVRSTALETHLADTTYAKPEKSHTGQTSLLNTRTAQTSSNTRTAQSSNTRTAQMPPNTRTAQTSSNLRNAQTSLNTSPANDTRPHVSKNSLGQATRKGKSRGLLASLLSHGDKGHSVQSLTGQERTTINFIGQKKSVTLTFEGQEKGITMTHSAASHGMKSSSEKSAQLGVTSDRHVWTSERGHGQPAVESHQLQDSHVWTSKAVYGQLAVESPQLQDSHMWASKASHEQCPVESPQLQDSFAKSLYQDGSNSLHTSTSSSTAKSDHDTDLNLGLQSDFFTTPTPQLAAEINRSPNELSGCVASGTDQKCVVDPGTDQRYVASGTDKRCVAPGTGQRCVASGTDQGCVAASGTDQRCMASETDQRRVASAADQRRVASAADQGCVASHLPTFTSSHPIHLLPKCDFSEGRNLHGLDFYEGLIVKPENSVMPCRRGDAAHKCDQLCCEQTMTPDALVHVKNPVTEGDILTTTDHHQYNSLHIFMRTDNHQHSAIHGQLQTCCEAARRLQQGRQVVHNWLLSAVAELSDLTSMSTATNATLLSVNEKLQRVLHAVTGQSEWLEQLHAACHAASPAVMSSDDVAHTQSIVIPSVISRDDVTQTKSKGNVALPKETLSNGIFSTNSVESVVKRDDVIRTDVVATGDAWAKSAGLASDTQSSRERRPRAGNQHPSISTDQSNPRPGPTSSESNVHSNSDSDSSKQTTVRLRSKCKHGPSAQRSMPRDISTSTPRNHLTRTSSSQPSVGSTAVEELGDVLVMAAEHLSAENCPHTAKQKTCFATKPKTSGNESSPHPPETGNDVSPTHSQGSRESQADSDVTVTEGGADSFSEVTSLATSSFDVSTSADESSYYSGDELGDEDDDDEDVDDGEGVGAGVMLGLLDEDRADDELRHERLQRHLASLLQQTSHPAINMETVITATGERLSCQERMRVDHVNQGTLYPFSRHHVTTSQATPTCHVTPPLGEVAAPTVHQAASFASEEGVWPECADSGVARPSRNAARRHAHKGAAAHRLFSPDRQVSLVSARQMTSREFQESYDRSHDAAKVKRSQLDSDIPWDLLNFSDTDDDTGACRAWYDVTSEEERFVNLYSTDTDSSVTSDW